MRKILYVILTVAIVIALVEWGSILANDLKRTNREQDEEYQVLNEENLLTGDVVVELEDEGSKKEEEEQSVSKELLEENRNTAETIRFVDALGQENEAVVHPDVKKHNYKKEAFVHNGDKLAYEDNEVYTYRLGIDVSHHQGIIDWNQVKEEGYEFAFVRLGSRGYGTEGTIYLDKEFERNVKNAQAAGMEVGIYFFTQAVDEEEAEEEAEFVLEYLKGYELELPVSYVLESILNDEARTDYISKEQFTRNAEVFCRMIADAGYRPMIYSDMSWEAYKLDLQKLSKYPIWYADYEPMPQTPYQFEFWQYSNTASVAGVPGTVDVNIQMIPLSEQ